VAEAVRAYVDAWDDVRLVVDEYRDLDDERVFVLYRFFGRGKASGLELGQVRTQAAHTDPALALRVYRQAMRRDEEEKAAVHARGG
jgi:hypothetical protein